MAIIWPFSGSVQNYAQGGSDIVVPRPDCPTCSLPMVFWSSYKRYVRHLAEDHHLTIKRARCIGCSTTHALIPSFILLNRLDTVDTVGKVLENVLAGTTGVRPAAIEVAVPHTTARGWIRPFCGRILEIGACFSALLVELGGEVISYVDNYKKYALSSIEKAFQSATKLPGWQSIGMWNFVSVITGGKIIATNTNSPFLRVGKRYFIYPVP